MVEISDNSNLTIPLRNLIGLLFATAVGVLGYAELNGRITQLEHGQQIQDMTIKDNAGFVREWPLGLRGALPADMLQDSKIMALEDRYQDIRGMQERLNELQIELNRVAGSGEVRDEKLGTLFDIWNEQVSKNDR